MLYQKHAAKDAAAGGVPLFHPCTQPPKRPNSSCLSLHCVSPTGVVENRNPFLQFFTLFTSMGLAPNMCFYAPEKDCSCVFVLVCVVCVPVFVCLFHQAAEQAQVEQNPLLLLGRVLVALRSPSFADCVCYAPAAARRGDHMCHLLACLLWYRTPARNCSFACSDSACYCPHATWINLGAHNQKRQLCRRGK